MISYGVGVLCDGQPIRRSGASIRERALKVEAGFNLLQLQRVFC